MIAAGVLLLIVAATVYVTAGLLPALLLLAAALALAAAGLLLLLLLLVLADAVAWWRARPAAPLWRPVLRWAAPWRIAAGLRTPARPPAHAAPSPRVRPETGPSGGSYRYRYHRKDAP